MSTVMDGQASERDWDDKLLADVHMPTAPDSTTWHLGRSVRRVDRLRSMAITVWLAWLVAAGVIVGGTLLVVLARLAAVVLRWAVAA